MKYAECLTVIAGASTSDDLSKYETLPVNIKEALIRKKKLKEEEAAEKAADAIIVLLEDAATTRSTLVKRIREHRKAIESIKGKLVEIKEAEDYASATQNYLPLAKMFGMVSTAETREIRKELLVIPEGWNKQTKSSEEGLADYTGPAS